MKKYVVLSMLLVISVLSACGQTPDFDEVNLEKNTANNVELASVYCEENGGIVSSEEGKADVCLFTDGSSCETVDFYNDECDLPESELSETEVQEGLIDESENDAQENQENNENVDNSEDIEEPTLVGLANPASVYCEENGGELEIKQGENGEYGICNFVDGTFCEEWAYFRGECTGNVAE